MRWKISQFYKIVKLLLLNLININKCLIYIIHKLRL